MLTTRNEQRGLTLIELLVASALAITVVIGIATMEGSRSQMQEELIARSGLTSGEGQAALATVQLSERLALTDWADINNAGGTFKLRIPSACSTPACLDNPASYRWDQYRLTGGVLRLYQGGCGAPRVVATEITSMTLAIAGNELAYVLVWDNGLAGPRNRTHEFQGTVASRAASSPYGGPLAPAPGLPGTC